MSLQLVLTGLFFRVPRLHERRITAADIIVEAWVYRKRPKAKTFATRVVVASTSRYHLCLPFVVVVLLVIDHYNIDTTWTPFSLQRQELMLR